MFTAAGGVHFNAGNSGKFCRLRFRNHRSSLMQQQSSIKRDVSPGSEPDITNHGCHPCVFIIMGVSGSGKSAVGLQLARRLGCPFYEGDSYHPPANIAKMRAGTPLDDADRLPWLIALHSIVQQHLQSLRPAVISCSALKPNYREILLHGPAALKGGAASQIDSSRLMARQSDLGDSNAPERLDNLDSKLGLCDDDCDDNGGVRVAFVLLDPPLHVLQQRLYARADEGAHFMPPSLLETQLAILEYEGDELFEHVTVGPDGTFPSVQQIVDGLLSPISPGRQGTTRSS